MRVVLLGDFNVKFPRRYRDIIGPYAHRAAGRKIRHRTKQLLQMFEVNNLCVPSTYFRPKNDHTIHTWRGTQGARSQIDYIVASKRWRSCFFDSKVYWTASRLLSGKMTDHGLLITTSHRIFRSYMGSYVDQTIYGNHIKVSNHM